MTITPIYHVLSPRWAPVLRRHRVFFTRVLHDTLSGFDLPRAVSLAVVLTDDNTIRVMNRDFRNKDKATNILSFPLVEDFNFPDKPKQVELGDMILAHETIAREAAQQGKTMRDHMAHLLVHGCLHLLGYDHMTKRDATEMEAEEIRILKKFNIANPYIISSSAK